MVSINLGTSTGGIVVMYGELHMSKAKILRKSTKWQQSFIIDVSTTDALAFLRVIMTNV